MPTRLALCCAGLALLTLAAQSAGADEFTSDSSTTQIVSAFVGANVYIPATVVVVAGSGHTLSIFNATDQPHGFAIAGLAIETVLEPQQETEVPLPKLKRGRVYRIHCQLHAAHRGGTLVVLPDDD